MRISKPSGPVLSQLRKATISTREGFGSFHCEDVETLIRQKDEEYQQPEVYDEILSISTKRNAEIVRNFEYGTNAKSSLFVLGRRTFNHIVALYTSVSAFSSDDRCIISCVDM